MENKKILFIRTPPYDLNFNTYNTQQIGLGRAFCELGYDFDFVTFKKRNQKEITFYKTQKSTGRIIEMPRVRISRWGFNRHLLDANFLNRYYMVIVQEYYQPMSYFVSKKASNVCLYSGPYWNLFRFKFISPIYDFLFVKRMNKNLVCKFTKSSLASNYLENKGYTNTECVGVGLETTRYDNIQIQSEYKKIVEDMQNNTYIMFVGYINPNKNVKFVLRLFEKLYKNDNKLKLLIVGNSAPTMFERISKKNHNSYYRKILNNECKLSKSSVIHLSNVPNSQLKFFYEAAKVLVLPSKHEIFGMVMLEAMYFGLPVVSSFNGGSSTLIQNNTTGLIVNKFNLEEWVMSVSKIIYDKEFSANISRSAKKNVKDNYNWDNIAKRMLNSFSKERVTKKEKKR